jgi:hypothetical protein
MADYVAECMHRRANDKAVVRQRPRRLRSARLAQEAEGAGDCQRGSEAEWQDSNSAK